MKTFTSVFISLTMFCTAASHAQPGNLDSTFGVNGIVTTAIGNYSDDGAAVAIQSDGKILVAGSSSNDVINQFALVRYNSNGSVDSTFAVNGSAITAIGGPADYGYGAKAVVIQQDGKIVIGGIAKDGASEKFTLIRFHPDGSTDLSFGSAGIVETALSFTCGVFALAIQSDSKIIAVGYTFVGMIRFGLARYNSDGTLDNSFGTNGEVTTAFGIGDVEPFSVALQEDGKIVVCGYADGIGGSLFALARYNTNGTLDNSFGTGGIVTTENGYGNAVAIQPDGKILVAGTALLRYDSDGTLDNSFGTDGISAIELYCSAISILTDEKILLAGNSGSSSFALGSYNMAGAPDSLFGNDGIVTTSIGDYSYIYGMAIQTDGKIVTAGTTTSGSFPNNVNKIALARYYDDQNTGFSGGSSVNNAFSIFPNPFSERIKVSFSSDKKTELQIINAIGQIIFAETIFPMAMGTSSVEIDGSQFPEGIYLMKLKVDGIYATQKLICQK